MKKIQESLLNTLRKYDNIWGILPTTIIVLVAINQPFTLWLLYSFFKTVPKELDESGMIDGCSHFQAGPAITIVSRRSKSGKA